MSAKSEQSEPLLSDKQVHDEADYGSFSIPKESFKELFDLDSIRLGISLENYGRLGGQDGVIKSLKSDEIRGIDVLYEEETRARKKAYGQHLRRVPPTKSFCRMVWEQLEDYMLRILILFAIISMAIGFWREGWARGWIEGVTIWIAVLIIVFVSSVNDYIKELQFRKLNAKRQERNITVYRSGNVESISIYQLLVGDVIEVETGGQLPVDCIVIHGELDMDESQMTGEPEIVKKRAPDQYSREARKQNPFLISGSKIMNGFGKAIVVCVGKSTFEAQLRSRLEEESGPTPLQQKLERIVNGKIGAQYLEIGKIGLIAALLTIIASIAHALIARAVENESVLTKAMVNDIINAIVLGITIVVMAIPEGLPLAVTIALAYSVGKMRKQNNLVRHLQASETMGGANNICTDKTGTLTQNKMTVVEAFIQDKNYDTDMLREGKFQYLVETTLFEGMCINSTANIIYNHDTKKEERVGSQTECALLVFAREHNFDYDEYRDKYPQKMIVPFNSTRKRSTRAVKINEDTVRVFVKGASEIVLNLCSMWLDHSGKPNKFELTEKRRIEEVAIKRYAHKAYRTFCLAYKDVDIAEFDAMDLENVAALDELESNLTMIAVLGIQDPLRPGIKKAVEDCRRAGVTVRMVTGDNKDTAIAISRDAQILSSSDMRMINQGSYVVMEGRQFREEVGGLYTVKENGKDVQKIRNVRKFREIIRWLRVLARSSPDDKYLLVTGLINEKNVVAVTGDGTNDAAALKRADVGFAMGIAGTEVAKDASDIILLDDNFSSIIVAMLWGRNIYNSIRKFIQFQLTVNIVAMFMAFLGGVVLGASPINAIQMLWVNLIMDTFASLALATEPPTDDLLHERPYTRNESIITPIMWRNIIGQALYQIIILTVMLFAGTSIFHLPEYQQILEYEQWQENQQRYTLFTMFFNTFVFLQVFNEFNARKLGNEFNVFSGICNNWMFFFIEILTIAVQVILVQFGGYAIKVVPLNWWQYLVCLCIGAFGLVVGALIKLIPGKLFRINMKEDPMTLNELNRSLSVRLRRKSTYQSFKTQQTLREAEENAQL